MFSFFKSKILLDENSLLNQGFSYELASKFSSLSMSEFVQKLSSILKPYQSDYTKRPYIHMFVGVNGVGKSSTIGKVANMLASKNTLLVAGDTFRAAASEQLKYFADKLGLPIFMQHQNADPASVVFDGIKKGLSMDYILVDTSGRLNTKDHLLAELERIHKVAVKSAGDPISQISLVLDTTSGLHLLNQVEDFLKYVPITDLIFTKTDSNAYLGTIVNVADKFRLPISYLCFGEKLENISRFDTSSLVEEISKHTI